MDEADLKFLLLKKEPLTNALDALASVEELNKDQKIPGLTSLKRWLQKEVKSLDDQYKEISDNITEAVKDIASGTDL